MDSNHVLIAGCHRLEAAKIGDVIMALKDQLTVFLTEQNFNMAVSVADDIYIVSKGSIVLEFKPDEILNDPEIKQKWLGV